MNLASLAKQLGMVGMSIGARTPLEDGIFTTGLASIPFAVPVSPDTLFHIGSNGKLVTAVAVLQLIDAQKISLRSRIGEILEGLPIPWRDRTVEGLLSHTSGIPEYTGNFAWDREYDRKTFLTLIPDPRPDFDEGASWSYSNTGYVLLGWILETLTGRNYRDVVNDDVLAPLVLPTAQVDDAQAVILKRAEPYDLMQGEPRHATRMASGISGWPDGGVLFSARDVASWDRAVSAGPMISARARARLLAPTRLTTGRTVPYGFALLTETLRGKSFQWHTGSVPGFRSYYLRAPDNKVGLLLMSNAGLRNSHPLRYLGQVVAEQLSPGSTPLSLMPINDRHPQLTREARQLLGRGNLTADTDRLAPEKRVLQARYEEKAPLPRFDAGRDAPKLEIVEDITGDQQLMRRYRLTYPERVDHVLIGYTRDERIFWAGM